MSAHGRIVSGFLNIFRMLGALRSACLVMLIVRVLIVRLPFSLSRYLCRVPGALRGEHERRVPFDVARREAFQLLLAAYDDRARNKTKSDTFVRVRAADPPRDVSSYSLAQ
jgi:hypothetical protein